MGWNCREVPRDHKPALLKIQCEPMPVRYARSSGISQKVPRWWCRWWQWWWWWEWKAILPPLGADADRQESVVHKPPDFLLMILIIIIMMMMITMIMIMVLLVWRSFNSHISTSQLKKNLPGWAVGSLHLFFNVFFFFQNQNAKQNILAKIA